MPARPANIDVRSLAREYTPQLVLRLARLANHAESESVQLGACIALLDRGWGKPASTFDAEEGGDIRIVVRHIICGQRIEQPPKLIEQGNGREKVGDSES